MPKIIRNKRILSHEEAQKEAKETCPPGMSYFLLSCHRCDKYDYCNLLWEFGESEGKHDEITTTLHSKKGQNANRKDYKLKQPVK